jgi:sialic acid synthase SpsE
LNKLILENFEISETSPIFIIAEIGINHNGNISQAMKLTKNAIECGANCVKFQFYKTDEFLSNKDHLYEYEVKGLKKQESMYEMFKRFELKPEDYEKLFKYIRNKNCIPLASAADPQSVKLLLKLGASAIKIASEDLINVRLLEYVSKINKPVLLSTGMADKFELEHALSILNKKELILMHCTSIYPAVPEELNLKKITTLQGYNYITGYSDHSKGILASIAAVTLGAKVIEKHFTLNNNDTGPDHSFSAKPKEFRQLVSCIREIEKSLGSEKLKPSPKEMELRNSYRRSIVAARDIQINEIITEEMINFKRPGNGLKPYEKEKVLNKKVIRALNKDNMITLQDIDN